MTRFVARGQRIVQPQGFVLANPEWIGRRMAFLWNAATPDRELLSGQFASTNNTAPAVVGSGLAVQCSSGQINVEWNRQFLNTSTGDGLGDFTLLAYANPSAGSALEHLIAQKNDAGGPPYCQAALFANADAGAVSVSGAAALFTYDGSGAASGAAAAGVCDGEWHVWVGIRRGVFHGLYRDGDLVAAVEAPVKAIIQSSPQRYFAVGSRGNGAADSYYDQIALAAAFDAALTDQEIAGLVP